MSFNDELKAHLARKIPDELTESTAALYAMVFSSFTLTIRGFGNFGLRYETSQSVAATYAFRLIKNTFGFSPELVKLHSRDNFGEKSRYVLTVDDPSDAMEMMHTFSMLSPEGVYTAGGIDEAMLTDEADRRMFLAGMFIACGYAYDPVKTYMMEFRMTSRQGAEAFCAMLTDSFGMKAQVRDRRSSYVVYIKRMQDVSDYMALAGAAGFMLQLENSAAIKELKLQAARAMNCDTGNMTKTLEAADRQLKAIDDITSSRGLSSLSEPLIKAAQLRLDNPEATLRELAKIAGISSSTLDKRFRKIISIAEEL